jgi:pre-rRNA-processing protein TSR3
MRYNHSVVVLMEGHEEWAQDLLKGFSWGHAFFDVNGTLLARYAECVDAEEVGKVQEEWLARLEREWVESREGGEGDEWAGGNPNRPHEQERSEEDEDEGEEEEEEEEEEEDKEEDTTTKEH